MSTDRNVVIRLFVGLSRGEHNIPNNYVKGIFRVAQLFSQGNRQFFIIF